VEYWSAFENWQKIRRQFRRIILRKDFMVEGKSSRGEGRYWYGMIQSCFQNLTLWNEDWTWPYKYLWFQEKYGESCCYSAFRINVLRCSVLDWESSGQFLRCHNKVVISHRAKCLSDLVSNFAEDSFIIIGQPREDCELEQTPDSSPDLDICLPLCFRLLLQVSDEFFWDIKLFLGGCERLLDADRVQMLRDD
jgi:hypothetical protein